MTSSWSLIHQLSQWCTVQYTWDWYYITEHRFAVTISTLQFGHESDGCIALISVYLCVKFFRTLFSDDMSTRSLVCVALNAWKMMNCEGIAWSGRGVITRKPISVGWLRKITANIIRVSNIDCEPNRESCVYTLEAFQLELPRLDIPT